MKLLNIFSAATLFATFAIPSILEAQRSICTSNMNDGRAFWLAIPSLDPRWRAIEGMVFTENNDGTATLRGAMINLSDPNLRFSIDAQYSGRLDPGMPNYPPLGSPYMSQFVQSNLITNGGTIDPNTWHYYTGWTGTLRGRLDLEGAVVSTVRIGPAFQCGRGADLLDTVDGGSGWFESTVQTQPLSGAITLPAIFQGDMNANYDTNCRCFGGQTASWSNYGSGLAGCSGVPSLTMVSDPLTFTAPLIRVSSADSVTQSGALTWGLAPAQTFNSFLGGDLLVAQPWVSVDTISVPANGYGFNCTIREDPCQIGMSFYAQAIVLDPCAAQGFAMSPGLRINIGDM